MLDDSEKYVVRQLTRRVDRESNLETYIVHTEPFELVVDYIQWHKKYSHRCDLMKSPDDPTVDLSKVNDPVDYPLEMKTWLDMVKN